MPTCAMPCRMLGIAFGTSSPSMTSWNRSAWGIARSSATVAAESLGAALAMQTRVAGNAPTFDLRPSPPRAHGEAGGSGST
jgi:hypothetical protein